MRTWFPKAGGGHPGARGSRRRSSQRLLSARGQSFALPPISHPQAARRRTLRRWCSGRDQASKPCRTRLRASWTPVLLSVVVFSRSPPRLGEGSSLPTRRTSNPPDRSTGARVRLPLNSQQSSSERVRTGPRATTEEAKSALPSCQSSWANPRPPNARPRRDRGLLLGVARLFRLRAGRSLGHQGHQ